ncbi:hypothetical protein JX265_003601 [Neoarthrinium moseri]|uniref:DUF7704 domain-containing protein n=1 Tax=Neoarthrinium moseri TaxID=1658444 RepID=A0A9P9WSK1_9PEZI|nr:uncharacterized protein JN550_002344 [Neoarthrinium moseri]KAI1854076.1 hypothetical protein JX266_001217 [Neoarthrinium moseri]KAI1874915.1 hypothetical protein JN550_002344 [Neoarthrinium moseri]KAI1877593.1 hypothetical protein JX265_003601 [Neoarthrinium moseri]
MAPATPVQIPLLYRALFLYIEPLGALLGALLLHWRPQPFLNTMAPGLGPAAGHQVVYDMLCATYVLFAFNEAVLLRLRPGDLAVWRAVLAGILLCDAIHLYGSAGALGPAVFWDPRRWRWEDAVNLGSLWGQGAVRVAFLCGVGLPSVVGGKGKRV